MERDRAYLREFLYRAIEDTQDTIRSLDAKAGVAIVILGAMVGWVLDRGVRYISGQPWEVVVAFVIFAFFALLSSVFAVKVLFPMVNPARHVYVDRFCRPAFFVSGLERSSVWRLFSSSERFASFRWNHSDYCASIRYASEEDVEKSLAAEVLKLAFIRQLKNDRLVALAAALVLAIVFFVVLVVALPDRRSSARPDGASDPAILVHDSRYVPEVFAWK